MQKWWFKAMHRPVSGVFNDIECTTAHLYSLQSTVESDKENSSSILMEWQLTARYSCMYCVLSPSVRWNDLDSKRISKLSSDTYMCFIFVWKWNETEICRTAGFHCFETQALRNVIWHERNQQREQSLMVAMQVQLTTLCNYIYYIKESCVFWVFFGPPHFTRGIIDYLMKFWKWSLRDYFRSWFIKYFLNKWSQRLFQRVISKAIFKVKCLLSP